MSLDSFAPGNKEAPGAVFMAREGGLGVLGSTGFRIVTRLPFAWLDSTAQEALVSELVGVRCELFAHDLKCCRCRAREHGRRQGEEQEGYACFLLTSDTHLSFTGASVVVGGGGL